MAGLLDNTPYGLTMDKVVTLTPRQISYLYYRRRDKNGNPMVLPYLWIDKESKELKIKEQFLAMNISMGKTREQALEMWEVALRNSKHGR